MWLTLALKIKKNIIKKEKCLFFICFIAIKLLCNSCAVA